MKPVKWERKKFLRRLDGDRRGRITGGYWPAPRQQFRLFEPCLGGLSLNWCGREP
jgi:hypothetical protein